MFATSLLLLLLFLLSRLSLFFHHLSFHDPAPTQIYTLSLHDALPIYRAVRLPRARGARGWPVGSRGARGRPALPRRAAGRGGARTAELDAAVAGRGRRLAGHLGRRPGPARRARRRDRAAVRARLTRCARRAVPRLAARMAHRSACTSASLTTRAPTPQSPSLGHRCSAPAQHDQSQVPIISRSRLQRVHDRNVRLSGRWGVGAGRAPWGGTCNPPGGGAERATPRAVGRNVRLSGRWGRGRTPGRN